MPSPRRPRRQPPPRWPMRCITITIITTTIITITTTIIITIMVGAAAARRAGIATERE